MDAAVSCLLLGGCEAASTASPRGGGGGSSSRRVEPGAPRLRQLLGSGPLAADAVAAS